MWDYASDGYVHRLVQSKTDGKLVEVPSPAQAACGEHLSTAGPEYVISCTHSALLICACVERRDGICRAENIIKVRACSQLVINAEAVCCCCVALRAIRHVLLVVHAELCKSGHGLA